MVAGLRAGAPASAVEIYDWTTGLPPLLLVHLRYLDRNRHQAEIVASKIVAYQDQYPGRPVHLIGHSAGAGIALMAVEALPEGRQVSSITLLAAAVSPRYDLRPALARTERGIWNYSSLGDVAFLMAATTVCGTVDGVHGPAAGAIGFRLPRDATPGEQALYAQKLHERPYQLRMLADLNWGGHFGGTTAWFASHELALVMQESEPEQRWGHSLAGRMAEVGPAP